MIQEPHERNASGSPNLNETASSQPLTQTEAKKFWHLPRHSLYALGVLSFVNFLNYIDRQVLPAVAPAMLKDERLGLNDADLGYIEAALLLSFTILAPLFGRLGDRYPRARVMAAAAVIWSVATAFTGFADQFTFLPNGLRFTIPYFNVVIALSGVALALCFVRALVGVGESAYSTITPSLIADYFPPEKRATALGIFQAAIPMGFALGFVIGGVLAYYFGWRNAFMIVGVPGIITAIFIWRLREPARGATDSPPHSSDKELRSGAALTDEVLRSEKEKEIKPVESFWSTVWRVLHSRDWLLSTAGYTALTAALGAFATWATVLLTRDKGMTDASASITLGVIILLGGAMGTFGGGWLSDRIAHKRHNAYFLVCAVSTLFGILPTLLALVSPLPLLYLPAIFIAVTLLFVSNAPFHAILVASVPASVRAMSVALNIVIIHTFGDTISRALVGVMSESLRAGKLEMLAHVASLVGINPRAQHLSAALLLAPLALLVASLFFFIGAKTTKRVEDQL